MNLQLLLLVVVATAFCNVALAEGFAYVAYNDSYNCLAYKALLAYFGPRLPAEGLTGYLTRVIPPNACHAIENPPKPRQASEMYIALIEGYSCSLVEKVLQAQQAGYQSAIVYHVNSDQPITVMADDKEIQQLIKIPSLFIGQSVFLCLERALQGEEGAYIRLLPPKHDLGTCQDIAKTLPARCIVQDFKAMFVIITTISIIVGLRWHKRAYKIKLHKYKQGDKYETCAICMAEYKEGECLKVLSCSHTYHGACIDTWFNTQPTCPMCKQVVNTYERGDLPEQAGEEENEEEQDPEDTAFGEGYEDGYVEEEKDDASTEEGEWSDAPEKATV
ncbi:E3 ubiquitin-protein ligase RNF13-like [Patagioenas fasciata]|uniref:E3 ubiquitin-protein ligase RNF13-like n=1 Tax=Patagioenas fasciata TaxID=372321 RepID=UPI003A99EE1E